MKKLLLLFFLCFKASLSLQADPYYFELTLQPGSPFYSEFRNTHTMHVLGTIHDLPFEELPAPVRAHVLEQQRKGAVFLGETATGVHKNRQVNQEKITYWHEQGYLRTSDQESDLDTLNSQQKQQLCRYINIVYPELTKQTTSLIRLDDFNYKGLAHLYRLGRQQFGMDKAIADLFGERKRRALDKKNPYAYNHKLPPGESETFRQKLKKDITYEATGHDPRKMAYLKGHLESFRSKASLEKPLVKDRNDAWIPYIMQGWKRDHVLVGVGCAHLIDLPDCKHSVLELLRKEGFSIKRMRDDGTWVHYADAIGADPPAPVAPPSKQPTTKTPPQKVAASKKAQSAKKGVDKGKHKKKLKKAKRTKAHQRHLARLKQQRLKQQRLNRIKRAKTKPQRKLRQKQRAQHRHLAKLKQQRLKKLRLNRIKRAKIKKAKRVHAF